MMGGMAKNERGTTFIKNFVEFLFQTDPSAPFLHENENSGAATFSRMTV
jgi:hypothetical protein